MSAGKFSAQYRRKRAATAKAIAAAGVHERYAREYLRLQEQGYLATGAAAGVDGAFWRAKQERDAKWTASPPLMACHVPRRWAAMLADALHGKPPHAAQDGA